MVMASYPITWTITSLLFWVYYLSGSWLDTGKKARSNAR